MQKCTDVKKIWQVYTLVDVQIIGLHEMFKLVSLCLQTQVNTMLHVCECCGTIARKTAAIFPASEITQIGQAGTRSLLKLIYNY